jgi:hypothetical protein
VEYRGYAARGNNRASRLVWQQEAEGCAPSSNIRELGRWGGISSSQTGFPIIPPEGHSRRLVTSAGPCSLSLDGVGKLNAESIKGSPHTYAVGPSTRAIIGEHVGGH